VGRDSAEDQRQEDHIELIASENYTSPAVMEAQGSQLTNKYAEGYPGKRYYGGCEFVDIVEQLAIDRVKKLFGAEAANVQPNSGSQANQAVFMAFLQARRHHHGHEPGRRRPPHPRHGAEHVRQVVQRRRLRPQREGRNRLRQDGSAGARTQAEADHRRRLGLRAAIDFERFAKVAKAVGAIFMVDMAHYAGLIAAGVYPNPVPHADVVTSTTHKTLRGPRGGIILMKAEHEKALNSAIFPGLQGGPLMHVIAGKAVAFKEAWARNSSTTRNRSHRQRPGDVQGAGRARPAHRLRPHRKPRVPGRPAAKNLTGKEAEAPAGPRPHHGQQERHPQRPAEALRHLSGIRIGTPAMTTRGFTELEAEQLAHLIADVLDAPNDEAVIERVKGEVAKLVAKFPVYG
jgi:glycine hydroxymethyltransferase